MARPDNWTQHSVTAARQDLVADNNDTWMNAFQFGAPDDSTWSLTGQHFELDVKRNPYDQDSLLSLSTGDGRIIIDSESLRVIHFNVAPADIKAALAPGDYVYDLIMVDATNPLVRIKLMYGTLSIVQGVTF